MHSCYDNQQEMIKMMVQKYIYKKIYMLDPKYSKLY